MKPSKKSPKIIIVIGPQGSGKGTQAKLLQKKFGLEYLGSGDAVRKRQKVKDFTGRKLLDISWRKGELIPSFLISQLWAGKLEDLKKRSHFNGIILDGWTRILVEAQMLDEALEWYEWDKNVKVLLINISRKESFNRLTKRRQCKKCGRLIPWIGEFKNLKKCDKCGGELFVRRDDSMAAIKMRLEEYKKETIPAINYYKKQKKLIEINGEQSIENVFKEILRKIRR
jgi:adenylate kinase